MGLPSPTPRGPLLDAQKWTEKALKGCYPLRIPNLNFICALTYRVGSPEGACPSSAALQLLPTSFIGGKAAGEYGAFLLRSDSEAPAADSPPLRGRQAEFFKYQSPRSEPRRKLPFTGHRSSSLGSVSEKPPFILGFLGATAPKQLFGYFLSAQKVTPGVGRKAPLVPRHSAVRRTTARS